MKAYAAVVLVLVQSGVVWCSVAVFVTAGGQPWVELRLQRILARAVGGSRLKLREHGEVPAEPQHNPPLSG